jgi:RNA 2',3'-cyclic 3'-phosphodiesterase
MRIFIALDIPADVRAGLTKYMERARLLAPEARWARVEGLHVTLKFVGEASEAKVQEIQAALSSLNSPPPFVIRFEDVGFFPNTQLPRSFWIDVRGTHLLHDLATTIDKTLAEVGIKRESKPYRPHLTLARCRASAKDLKGLTSIASSRLTHQFGVMTVNEFFMFRSELGKEGARYAKIASFQLKTPSG